MVGNINNNQPETSRYVNWGTVWGFIMLVVGLNMYAEYQMNTNRKHTYQSQLQLSAREIDSLRMAKQQLDRQLQYMQSALDQCQTGGSQ